MLALNSILTLIVDRKVQRDLTTTTIEGLINSMAFVRLNVNCYMFAMEHPRPSDAFLRTITTTMGAFNIEEDTLRTQTPRTSKRDPSAACDHHHAGPRQ